MSDAAIRQNRRGCIPVAEEIFEQARALLSEHISAVSVEPEPETGYLLLHGYSDHFDALPLGAAPPRYVALLQYDGGSTRLLRFERMRCSASLSL